MLLELWDRDALTGSLGAKGKYYRRPHKSCSSQVPLCYNFNTKCPPKAPEFENLLLPTPEDDAVWYVYNTFRRWTITGGK